MGWGTGNLGGGSGGLNFKVVGYATEAELLADTPKENTIGIITTNKITGWMFAAADPAEPVEGMVYITTGKESDIAFNALKKNGIQVYPLSAKQYVTGAWVDVTAYSYQGGEWVEMQRKIYLFEHGDECISVTGGWVSEAHMLGSGSGYSSALTVTAIENGVKLTQGIGGGAGIYRTKNKINFDNAKNLGFTGEIYKDSNYAQNIIGFCVYATDSSDLVNDSAGYFKATNGTTTFDNTTIIDVSNITGDNYVAAFIMSSDGKYINMIDLYLET